MSDDEARSQEVAIRQAIAQAVQGSAPQVKKAIEDRVGKKISDADFAKIFTPMTTVATEVTVQATETYAGPMPSPRIMAGYASVFPGAPEQLFRQFEAEQAHRHEWENKALELTSAERKRRDYSVYVISSFGLLLAGFIASLGDTIAASILTGLIVLGGGAIILGKQFLASHTKDGTHLAIQPDGSNSHAESRAQQASRRRRASQNKPK